MAKGYDITLQITVKDVRVDGRATEAQVARAICNSIVDKYGSSPMDLFGLDHGGEVTRQLHDAGVDASVEFYGNAKCKVVNPSKGGRQGNPGVRKLVSDAMK